MTQGRKRSEEGPFVVVVDCRVHQASDITSLFQWIQATTPDELPDLPLDDPYSIHSSPPMVTIA
ncbi:hypothetical protein NtRootA4_23630 [Arthrobacter sp. NtRootA4]|nr:hypothetical protein NtRootA4_23630 [Arthrobacter sp. NtRootA4]BCW23719.1 hypothetical protein NtRootC7_25860 [Arthrobacter sp. NtRootC7]BCW32257.1 hypothetical protein NtRootD5_25880 [Arthrobacter sp. NtRootD5]